jgi:uncharacterized surface protein with fasciclin (FAS1) repeats
MPYPGASVHGIPPPENWFDKLPEGTVGTLVMPEAGIKRHLRLYHVLSGKYDGKVI